MATGTVKWFDDEKGYGFIKQDDGSKDAFVHFSQVNGEGRITLHEGQRVEYDTEETDKGLAAINVEVLPD